MRELIYFYILSIVFLGCGNDQKKMSNPLQYYQWSLYYNPDFYKAYNIDFNASINHKKDFRKYTGKNVKIVVIDDGVDRSHEDLQGIISETWDLETKSNNVSHYFSNEYHGTSVTGIIAAQDNTLGIRGLAPESEIIFLRHKQNMSNSETLELLNKAYSYNPDIINCSWGTYHVSQSVKEKIQDMAINGRNGKGIVFVWAAGNDQKDIETDESAIEEVIAVGSTNKNNELAYLNNYGEELDLLAPSGDYELGITTLDVMGNQGIGTIENNYILSDNEITFDGTSASTPIVTGVVAIILELNPMLTRKEIQDILITNTDKVGGVEYVNGHNIFYGYGKVNLSKTIDYVNGMFSQ